MENTPINDNVLDSELTSNESEIGAEGLDSVLQSAGFASLQDAYDQTNTDNLEELYEILEQQVNSETAEDNPILGLIRILGRLLGIGNKGKYKKHSSRKKLSRAVRRHNKRNSKKARSGVRQAVRGSIHTTRRRNSRPKKTIPPKKEKETEPKNTEPKGEKPQYNINPIPPIGLGSIPSTAPKANMHPMTVKFPKKKKPKPSKPPFRAKLKFYALGMLHPQGPVFDSNYSTQLQEMGSNLDRDSTYRLSITIGLRMAGRAYTPAEMNQTNLPAGGVLQGPRGNLITPNQALLGRARFILRQIAANVTDPMLRRSILSGRSSRINIIFNRNTANGPTGANIQAVR